jgi:hypothetical protein
MKPDNRIKKFFEGVEKASNTLDLELINVQYADPFIFADPNGTRVIEKQKFLPALPKRRVFSNPSGINLQKFCLSRKRPLTINTPWSKLSFSCSSKKSQDELWKHESIRHISYL